MTLVHDMYIDLNFSHKIEYMASYDVVVRHVLLGLGRVMKKMLDDA